MTTITGTDLGIAGELALLVLNNENAREESDRAERDLARAMRQDAAENEVEALLDSADALETGAWVSGTLALVGGGVSIAGGTLRLEADGNDDLNAAKLVEECGDLVSGLAGPANTLVGQSSSQRFQARAKQAAFAGEQASSRVDDASQHLAKIEKNRERLLDAAVSLNQAEQAATNAVIGNV